MTELEVKNAIHNFYWVDDINCATTTLKTFAKPFSVNISTQVIDSAVGMHGAGKYGAQCGLVEGTLLFIGIYGISINLDDKDMLKYVHRLQKVLKLTFLVYFVVDYVPEDLMTQIQIIFVKK